MALKLSVMLLLVIGLVDGLMVSPFRRSNRMTISMRKGRPSTNIPKIPKEQGSSGPAVNWVEINETSLPVDDGTAKAVTLPGDKIMMVLKKDETFFGLSSSCTKCKFPLLKAAIDEETDSVICDVCGSKFSYKNGDKTGRQKKEGLAGMFSDVMSSGNGGPLESFEVRKAPNGKVYVAAGLK